MELDDYLKISQIGFYITAGTVAVLTYIKAKNGLLNAVNTEYKKRVMDRLDEISRDLLSEYDPDSPNYWLRQDSVGEVLRILHKDIAQLKDRLTSGEEYHVPIPVSNKESSLYRQSTLTKSDPFIPRSIRDRIVDFFENRADVMSDTYIEEIKEYVERLKEGKGWDTLETNHHVVHNKIIQRLLERGCGIDSIEKEVHDIRISIQEYFEKFDPIKNT